MGMLEADGFENAVTAKLAQDEYKPAAVYADVLPPGPPTPRKDDINKILAKDQNLIQAITDDVALAQMKKRTDESDYGSKEGEEQ